MIYQFKKNEFENTKEIMNLGE